MRNYWSCVLMIIVLCLVKMMMPALAQQHNFNLVTSRIITDLQGKQSRKSRALASAKNLAAMQPDGSWMDIQYHDPAVSIWSPAEHLSRVEGLALAYHDQPGDALFNAIVKALRYWNKADPKCHNWWYNEISCPQTLGQIMLLMQEQGPVPKSLQDSLLKKMDRGNMYTQIGANKLDVALHNVYSALLKHDSALMDSAVAQCYQPVVLTTDPEGLQYDYSYLQHGPQLQIASYGSVFLVGEYKVASFFSGTKWQMPSEQRKALGNFLDRAFLNAIRYKYFDFNVMGRGFTRKDSGNAGAISGMYANIGVLKKSEPVIYDEFAAYDNEVKRRSGKVAVNYAVKPLHAQFWIGDYTQHVSPDYLFTVRTNSTRTKRTETGNGENLYGRYMSDGATNIQRSGSEYFNIFPVWEFDKIPGVTCRDYAADRPAVNSWDQSGTTNFTGGVSDGVYGACTYTLDFDSVKAKKSWFFFGKQIVCLGAGIRSAAQEYITTAVNQCWSRGGVIQNESAKAYWHDSIGYYFQPEAKVLLSNVIQKGTWNHINSSQSKEPVSGKVFKLWIDHGMKPQNAGYAYVVVPGISAGQFKQDSPFSELSVLVNNEQQQAVYSKLQDMLQVVFYQPGMVQVGKIKVSVDKPCVVLIRKLSAVDFELFVADPTHLLESVAIDVNGRKLNCALPVKEYAGSTMRYVR